jgi:type I restriction enzyme M protein
MRRKLIESDLVEAVIGIAPHLFYNSPMDACVVICRTEKQTERKGKILIVDASKQVSHEGTFTYLSEENIAKIADAYARFENIDEFAKVITIDEAAQNGYSLNIPLYIGTAISSSKKKVTVAYESIDEALDEWNEKSVSVAGASEQLVSFLEEVEVDA